MTIALVLFMIYIWAELVFMDNPSFRKFLVAPIAVPLVIAAMALLRLVNLLAGTDYEVWL